MMQSPRPFFRPWLLPKESLFEISVCLASQEELARKKALCERKQSELPPVFSLEYGNFQPAGPERARKIPVPPFVWADFLVLGVLHGDEKHDPLQPRRFGGELYRRL